MHLKVIRYFGSEMHEIDSLKMPIGTLIDFEGEETSKNAVKSRCLFQP